MSGRERTGWRDARLSERHREWGIDCPGNDIDFLLIEYNHKIAMALVDYKHERVYNWPVDKSHANYMALVNLADRPCECGSQSRRVPAFACRYADDMSWFEPDPLNELASVWVPAARRMSEAEWVSLLYRMRGIAVPAYILRKLASEDAAA